MIGPANPVATPHGRSGSRSGHRHRLLIPVRTPAAGSGTGAYTWRVVGLGFPTRRFPPHSCSPGLPPGRFVMLGLGTFPPVFVFTEFANSSLGLKPGKPSAFSIHSPPFPAGLQKDPGNAVGRTSDALRGRAPLPKLPAKPGELATTQHRPTTAGLHHRGPSSTLPSQLPWSLAQTLSNTPKMESSLGLGSPGPRSSPFP